MYEHAVELRAPSLAATHEIAAIVADVVRLGDVVVLAGEMGSGKTAFAQGFGRAMGITEPITSPTFTLVHSYDVPGRRCTVHHADLYRLDRTTEIADLALLELAEDHGIVLIEWGDVAEQFLGDHLTVVLERPDDLDDDPDVDLDDGSESGGPSDEEGPSDEFDFGLDEGRLITVSASGSSWAGRWSPLVESLGAHRC